MQESDISWRTTKSSAQLATVPGLGWSNSNLRSRASASFQHAARNVKARAASRLKKGTSSSQKPNDRAICCNIANAPLLSAPSLKSVSVATTEHTTTVAMKMPLAMLMSINLESTISKA